MISRPRRTTVWLRLNKSQGGSKLGESLGLGGERGSRSVGNPATPFERRLWLSETPGKAGSQTGRLDSALAGITAGFTARSMAASPGGMQWFLLI